MLSQNLDIAVIFFYIERWNEIMKRIFLVLTLTFIISAMSSTAFAADYDEARDAMITYSGTEAFTKLLPEERQACMYWVYGGEMNETCRNAITHLLSEAPDAVTSSQRRALLAAASGNENPTSPQPVQEREQKKVEKDNTGALVAAGVAAVILGMVIHNNIGGSSHSRHGPPPPPPHYRPAPAPYHRMPPRR